MQQLTIAGTLGKDAELRKTGNGDAVAGFSVAVDNGKDKNGTKRETTWIDCSLWGKRGEALSPYLTKGLKVAITGRPTVRAYDGKAYLGCSVNEITLMGGGEKSSGQSPQAPASQNLDDEIPFQEIENGIAKTNERKMWKTPEPKFKNDRGNDYASMYRFD